MIEWFVAPENDYRELLERAVPEPHHRVTVVIPVYNRVSLLGRTLAGLVVQDYPRELLDVVVADDGSTEDVPAAVRPYQDRLDVHVVRREHQGYGAGQARNLGARRTEADVLVFIDADCVPAPDLVRVHAGWHGRASNLVVIGARHHLDTSLVDAERIASGEWAPESGGTAPSDWRGLFYRRTAQLRAGDEAYRALVSSNFSVRRDRFLEVGGFSEDFVRWGGEDTELGWRLFRSGCFVVAENGAVIHHQTQEDEGDEGWRERSRRLNDGIITTKIPHRFYRRSRADVIYETPKLSWVIAPTVPRRAEILLEDLRRQSLTDWEVVFVDAKHELGPFADLHRADPRVVVVPGSELDAVARARGEVIAVVHGWASLDHRLGARVVRHLDNRPRTSVVTVGIQAGTGDGVERYQHATDAPVIAGRWGVDTPIVGFARGREWAKVRRSSGSLAEAWQQVVGLGRGTHMSALLAGLPATSPTDELPVAHRPFVSDRSALVTDLRAAAPDPKQAAGVVARYVKTRITASAYRPAPTAPAPDAPRPSHGLTHRPGIRYVGWVGKDNLGDEAMLEAARRLMPWGDVATSGDPTDLLVLGGGTLINRRIYLDWLRDKDSPRSERAVLGTGVASPDFWGLTEKPADWVEFLGTCAYVGVRGPVSHRLLRGWGYEGQLEICGDPALAFTPPADVERVPGRLVISPLHTDGELHGEDDERVLEAFAETVARQAAAGREVWTMSCHPADDRWCMEVMRRAGHPGLPHCVGYADLDATLRLLVSADAVVAERLHGAVLAAAMGTPFVAIEYRPKVRDFASSLDLEEFVIRTDEVDADALADRLSTVETRGDELREQLTASVDTYRVRLRHAADQLRSTVT